MDSVDKTSNKTKCSQSFVLFGIAAVLGLQIVCVLFLGGIIPGQFDPESGSLASADGPELSEADTNDDHEQVKITKTYFGRSEAGEDIHKYTFLNKNGLELEVLSLGGVITKLTAPCRHGHLRDVIAGYDQPKQYISNTEWPFAGALIGRYANRISRGQFTLDGISYNLSRNNGENHLHGGPNGWHKKVWRVTMYGDHIVLRYLSPDGDEGYPGEVDAQVTYRLTNDNQVSITFHAQARGKATPINLTAHPYFNLGGQGNKTIYDHNVTIYADKYVDIDDQLLPTGTTPDVTDTLFDFRRPVTLGDRINNVTVGGMQGYGHCFVLRGPTGKKLAATVHHPHSGRIMDVYTDQPGLLFYTGNFLDVECGKGCQHYDQHTSFCMETQNFPDAINHPNFPDSVLRPGSEYDHQVWFRFYADASPSHDH